MAFSLSHLLNAAAQGYMGYQEGQQGRRQLDQERATQEALAEAARADARRARLKQNADRQLDVRKQDEIERSNRADEEAARARERRMRLPDPVREEAPVSWQRQTMKDGRVILVNPKTGETRPLTFGGEQVEGGSFNFWEGLMGGGGLNSTPAAGPAAAGASGGVVTEAPRSRDTTAQLLAQQIAGEDPSRGILHPGSRERGDLNRSPDTEMTQQILEAKNNIRRELRAANPTATPEELERMFEAEIAAPGR